MLAQAGFSTYLTDLGENAIDLARLFNYGLITLDGDLPDISGFEVLRRIRLAKVETPILMLTGQDDTASKIKAFGYGADDYLTKPFHREELIARIQAITRRARGQSTDIFTYGAISVDFRAKRVTVDNNPVHLTKNEYAILELMAAHPGTIVSKDQVFEHLYDGQDEPESRTIDVCICKLRKKLDTAGKQIETVWGQGYMLNAA